MKNLQTASETLKALNPISVSAGCDLFLRFITRTTHDVTVSSFINSIKIKIKYNNSNNNNNIVITIIII